MHWRDWGCARSKQLGGFEGDDNVMYDFVTSTSKEVNDFKWLWSTVVSLPCILTECTPNTLSEDIVYGLIPITKGNKAYDDPMPCCLYLQFCVPGDLLSHLDLIISQGLQLASLVEFSKRNQFALKEAEKFISVFLKKLLKGKIVSQTKEILIEAIDCIISSAQSKKVNSCQEIPYTFGHCVIGF